MKTDSKRSYIYWGLGALLIALVTTVAIRHRKAKKQQLDKQFTGAFPRFSGATSAVTGGPPEDINQMPAALDPNVESTVYDGSDLEMHRKPGYF